MVNGKQIPLNSKVFQAAAESGNIEVLEWLELQNCKWDSGLLPAARKSHNPQVVEWVESMMKRNPHLYYHLT
jgi:hypothetical protein